MPTKLKKSTPQTNLKNKSVVKLDTKKKVKIQPKIIETIWIEKINIIDTPKMTHEEVFGRIDKEDYSYGAIYKRTPSTLSSEYKDDHKNQVPSVVGVKNTDQMAAEIMEDEHGKWFEQTLANLQASKRNQDFWNKQNIRRDQFGEPTLLQKIKSFLGFEN